MLLVERNQQGILAILCNHGALLLAQSTLQEFVKNGPHALFLRFALPALPSPESSGRVKVELRSAAEQTTLTQASCSLVGLSRQSETHTGWTREPGEPGRWFPVLLAPLTVPLRTRAALRPPPEFVAGFQHRDDIQVKHMQLEPRSRDDIAHRAHDRLEARASTVQGAVALVPASL
jgi:hypothetical protein